MCTTTAPSQLLYLVEILIDEIIFSLPAVPGNKIEIPPPRKNLCIYATIGDFLVLDVRAADQIIMDVNAATTTTTDNHNNNNRCIITDNKDAAAATTTSIRYNAGKTCLFPSTPDHLETVLAQYPLHISVCSKDEFTPLATSSIVWCQEFLDIANNQTTYATKATHNLYRAMGAADQQPEIEPMIIVGQIKMEIRLTNLGGTIETDLQLVDCRSGFEGEQHLKLNATNTNTTTFYSQRCPNNNKELLPSSSMDVEFVASNDEKTTTSMVDLLAEPSSVPSFFTELFMMSSTKSKSISIMPTEFEGVSYGFTKNYYDSFASVNVLSSMTINEHQQSSSTDKTYDLSIQASSTGFSIHINNQQLGTNNQQLSSPTMIVKENLTAETINKLLCNHKDCPAAKKFKEYGIGPLASNNNNKGLGTLYGTMSTTPLPTAYGISNTYGTMANYGPYGLLATTTTKPESNKDPLLRLKGGGESSESNIKTNKSPLFECKEVMEELDKILEEYRKALGPCGQVTCPYALNLMTNGCQKSCNTKQLPSATDPVESNDVQASCQSIINSKQSIVAGAAACGLPTCPYAKYKTGLVDDDALLELQYLPPALSGKCGAPKCNYRPSIKLPPIHWDCPDPLPKTQCKNPDCPFLPADLKCLKKMQAKGPCGSPTCPYALPDPCASSKCPFKEQQKNEEEDNDDLCMNPDCPYRRENESDLCQNPGCPYQPPTVLDNNNKDDLCDNPDCPYNEKVDNDSLCNNPDCQYNPKKIVDDICKNPNCPYNKKQTLHDLCKNPNCPFKKLSGNDAEDLCKNPDCPFKVQPDKSNVNDKDCCLKDNDSEECTDPSIKNSSLCENVACPYAKKKNNSCEDLNCPFAKMQNDIINADDNSNCAVSATNNCCTLDNNDKSSIVTGDALQSLYKLLQSWYDKNCTTNNRMECESSSSNQAKSLSAGGGGGEMNTMIPCQTLTCHANNHDINCLKSKSDTGGHPPEGCQMLTCSKIPTNGKRTSRSEPTVHHHQQKHSQQQKRANGKKKSKYVYSIGDQYPGVQIGHRECRMDGFKIPSKMGWLWNIHTPCMSLKPRRGWRPGAIGKRIAERIRQHRAAKGLPMQELPQFGSKRRRKHGTYASSSDVSVPPKPTLQIRKRNGSYWITMNPLKDPNQLEDNENPYMDCTPIQFKITKNNKIRKSDGDDDDGGTQEDGYQICQCGSGDDIDTCGDEDRLHGAAASTSSSDSELDIEFTPPAGIIHPERLKKKKHVVHCDTQYDPKDFKGGSGGKGDKKGKKGGKKGKDKKKKKGKKK